MSALLPKADICCATRDVRFGPKADIFDLFDDFVGARENWWREGQIERFRGFEINYEFELAGLQHGQVCGICAFKDTGDEVTSLTIRLRQTSAVAEAVIMKAALIAASGLIGQTA